MSLCFPHSLSLVTEAEVEAWALSDGWGGACTGDSTGGDAAIWTKQKETEDSVNDPNARSVQTSDNRSIATKSSDI